MTADAPRQLVVVDLPHAPRVPDRPPRPRRRRPGGPARLLPGRQDRARLRHPLPARHRDAALRAGDRRQRERGHARALRALPHARGDGGGHARGGGAVRPHDRPLPQQGQERGGGRAAHRRALRRRGAATVEELVTLPGVGRKTANVVVANAFGVPAIAVDTHVGRLARRLGFSKHADPDKVEADLQKLFPRAVGVPAPRAHPARPPRLRGAQAGLRRCAVAELCPSRVG
jgi:hypothetical protein